VTYAVAFHVHAKPYRKVNQNLTRFRVVFHILETFSLCTLLLYSSLFSCFKTELHSLWSLMSFSISLVLHAVLKACQNCFLNRIGGILRSCHRNIGGPCLFAVVSSSPYATSTLVGITKISLYVRLLQQSKPQGRREKRKKTEMTWKSHFQSHVSFVTSFLTACLF